MTTGEDTQELLQQIKKADEKIDTLSNRLQKLENEYHVNKKVIIYGVGLLFAFVAAFLGFTVNDIPAKVKEAVDTIVGQETIKLIQEYKTQIEEQATQIEQYATDAGNNSDEIALIKKNIENDIAFLNFTNCGEAYSCTPKACLAKCIELGMSMATYDEVYSWASAGKDHCAYMWMLDSKQSDTPVSGYPMYHNQTTDKRCGRTNTGDIPRLEGVNSNASWDSGNKYDCACNRIITK